MMFFLQYIFPPILGAFIGFVTNVIAIKMLFRPLKEYRVFGIRVPFTPGILPSQRHKLAENIGTMVENELFTPELLRQRLSQNDVHDKLLESVSRFTGKILERPIESFFDMDIDDETRGLFHAFKNSALDSPAFAVITRTVIGRICAEAEKHYPKAASAVISFLRREDISKNLEIQGQRIITEIILGLNAFQRLLISAGQYENSIRRQMPDIIGNLLNQAEKLITSDKVRAQALNFFGSYLTKNLTAAKLPSDILPSIRKSILSEFPGQTPQTLLAIDSDAKLKLDNFLCSHLLKLAIDEIEGLLNSINIKTMVSQRIDALDMIRVEHIVLDIMANQLKWIDFFGGLLGFFIGLIQVVVNQIIRSL